MKYILAALVSLCLGSVLAAQDSGQDFIPEGFTEDEWNKFTSAQQESLLASASTYEEALARIRQFQEIYFRSALDNDRMAPELADTRRDCMLGSTQSVFEERALTGSFPPPVADLCLGALELSVEAELRPEIYNEGFIDYDRAAQINLLSRYRDMLDKTHIPATEQNARIFRRALFDTMADDVAALRESLTDPEVAANPGRVSAVETATDAFLLAEDPVLHDNKQYDVPLNPAYFENGPNGEDVVAGKPNYYPMLPSIAVDVGYTMTVMAVIDPQQHGSDVALALPVGGVTPLVEDDRRLLHLCLLNAPEAAQVTIGNCARVGSREAIRHLTAIGAM